ncbi:MAG: DsrE family protein [Betaproteobacteria bacterium]|nr:DsrE family protein [Betaproteobacteria bacterium]
MKRTLAALALSAAAVFGGGFVPQAHADTLAAKSQGKYQLVIQVTDDNPKVWNLALNNAFAFQRNVGKGNSEIEIVAIGPGLDMLKAESKVKDRIDQALDQSIDVVACGETMHAMKLTKDDLIGGVRVVPGGLIEIADKERAGWVYYRP